MKLDQICPKSSWKDADSNEKNSIPKFKLQVLETVHQTSQKS